MSDRTAALRAHLDALEAQEAFYPTFLAAKAKAKARPTARNRGAYREASRTYAELRSKARTLAVAVPTDGRSVTVVPSPVSK